MQNNDVLHKSIRRIINTAFWFAIGSSIVFIAIAILFYFIAKYDWEESYFFSIVGLLIGFNILFMPTAFIAFVISLIKDELFTKHERLLLLIKCATIPIILFIGIFLAFGIMVAIMGPT